MYLFKVTCTACDFEGTAREGLSGFFYQLPDGDTADVVPSPAWCRDCATVVDAEVVRSIADLERELSELENGGPALDALLRDLEGFDDKELPRRMIVESHRSTVKWRRLRVGPARCLRCGSHEIVHFDRRPDGAYPTLRHPSCEGWLTWRLAAHGSTPTRRQPCSVEGRILRQGDL